MGGRNRRMEKLLEELHNLYSSSNIIRVIKERRVRWVGHEERMEDMRNVNKIFI
jgi:hypothetical protein